MNGERPAGNDIGGVQRKGIVNYLRLRMRMTEALYQVLLPQFLLHPQRHLCEAQSGMMVERLC